MTPKELPLISICILVLNEELCLPALFDRLVRLADKLKDKCRLEFIFSDNHSEDSTWEIIEKVVASDDRFKGIRFTKNVGFQKSIMANYLHASGDAVFQIDADMQDPPEMLVKFFDLWMQGYQIVYGLRRKRPENIFISSFRKIGYIVVDILSDHKIPRNVGDFRLVDRKVLDAIFSTKNPTPYLRGLVAGFGFKSICVEFDRDKRQIGTTKFKISHLLSLGYSAIFNHSVAPLRLATISGVIILILSLIGSLYYVAIRYIYPGLPPGFASVHILVLFGIGLNSFFLGIMGEYILRIFLILRNDPIAIIEKSINLETKKLLI
jgi:dolichol-phosphate mannosyltransferase